MSCHTAYVTCTIESLVAQMDPHCGHVLGLHPDQIESEGAVLAVLLPEKPITLEPYSTYESILGVVAIRHCESTSNIGWGMVLSVDME